MSKYEKHQTANSDGIKFNVSNLILEQPGFNTYIKYSIMHNTTIIPRNRHN